MNWLRRLIEGYHRMYCDDLWRQRNAVEQDVRRLGGEVTWK
jgi:hypothetical protein